MIYMLKISFFLKCPEFRTLIKNNRKMKGRCIVSGILLFSALAATAQIHLFLQEQEVELRDSRSAAWVMPVTGTLEEALNDLRDYCRDRTGVRMRNEGSDQVIAEKVSIPIIITMRGDLIGRGFITENYNGLAMVFQLGYDISLNSRDYPVEMKNFRDYARSFMSYHYEQAYTRRIDALEKEIRSQERDINQNENRIGSMTRRIGNLNDRIEKEEDETRIESYRSEITTLEADIQQLSDGIPGIQSQIEIMKSNVEKLKEELNAYQTTIGSI